MLELSFMDQKIQYLNQMIEIIDSKVTIFKKNKSKIPQAAYVAEKQVLTRTIQDTIKLAEEIKPVPFSLINDLKSLIKQL
ncbi:hypothetical protein NUH30_01600 [Leptospira sp. 85282-16]|uniref:Uncharacterized protein n=1 Tax=Leptospira montravelensis TaxID=2484961 RepID=A0ABY2LXS3_9LEPT|nr:hypothetical protein [Leptospira sp. 85282-16]MCT8332355.1 hypothetical protein [Leptospira sp. 85282-16]TGK83584.1 hypothetical protein EHQ19_03360 [Leptospira montravelensis]TGL05587.1 hypothetical protein EHQ31_02395 [Leptospira montravelensis]